MKKLQNCLYVTRQKTYMHKERETLVIKEDKTTLLQLPIHSLQHLFCFGNVLVSPFVLGFCSEKGVGLSFFTEYGKFLGRLHGTENGNILLRKAQYRIAENSPALLAQTFVAAKVANSRNVLQRHIRNHGENQHVKLKIAALNRSLDTIKKVDDITRIRGFEGEAAANYFSALPHLITNNAENFTFTGRNRQPPKDPINAMLSFAYSLISSEVSSSLQGVGLDPQAGFLHADRPGRDSLAHDLLEEFRAWWADLFVFN